MRSLESTRLLIGLLNRRLLLFLIDLVICVLWRLILFGPLGQRLRSLRFRILSSLPYATAESDEYGSADQYDDSENDNYRDDAHVNLIELSAVLDAQHAVVDLLRHLISLFGHFTLLHERNWLAPLQFLSGAFALLLELIERLDNSMLELCRTDLVV